LGVGPSSYTSNVKLAQNTLDKIIEFVRIYPQTKVVFGHEL
jgi:N-acyl homoserine lactone hydrolase